MQLNALANQRVRDDVALEGIPPLADAGRVMHARMSADVSLRIGFRVEAAGFLAQLRIHGAKHSVLTHYNLVGGKSDKRAAGCRVVRHKSGYCALVLYGAHLE